MKIIDSVPQFWYLLEDDSALILTVSCEYSFISYDFTMQLQPQEVASYRSEGSAYLSRLSEAINYSCPAARGSASPYKERNIDPQYNEAILQALQRRKRDEASH